MNGHVFNGELRDGGRLTIELAQPYFAHGAGLFETLRGYGGRPCHFALHVERMLSAAAELGVRVAFDVGAIEEQVLRLLDHVGLEHARVKLHILVRDDRSSDFLVTAAPAHPLAVVGESVRLGRAARAFDGVGAMAGFKTMNYMVNRMAMEEGQERGLDEVYFTLPDGTVTEGSRSTVFAVVGGTLRTASLDLPVLPGVTRHVILELATEKGLPVEERAVSTEELQRAEEAFLSGSVMGLRPVTSVDDVVLPSAPGALTSILATALHATMIA